MTGPSLTLASFADQTTDLTPRCLVPRAHSKSPRLSPDASPARTEAREKLQGSCTPHPHTSGKSQLSESPVALNLE